MNRIKPWSSTVLIGAGLFASGPLVASGAVPSVSAGSARITGEPDVTHTNVGAIMLPAVEGGPRLPGYEIGQYFPGASGTLIHERVFLTAGHVTQGTSALNASGLIPLELFYVTFDREPANVTLGGPIPPTWRRLSDVITHPAFGLGGVSRFYSGVLILEEPVTAITPATLPSAPVFTTGNIPALHAATFTVVGYGARAEFTQNPGSFVPGFPPLQFLFDDLTRKFADLEYNLHFDVFGVFSMHFDGAVATADQGAGFGDSGGPIFMQGPGGTETLVSTVIVGIQERFVLTQRVDIPEIRGFIDGVIASLGP